MSRSQLKDPSDNIEISRFSVEDQATYLDFLRKRNLSEHLLGVIPLIGWIAKRKDIPIGAIFIREVEGRYALIDGLITDPTIHPIVRHRAIDRLVSELIKYCQQEDYKKIFAFTADNSTLKRSFMHGFQVSPDVLITLPL